MRVAEADLDSFIAVVLDRLHLCDDAGTCLKDSDGNEGSVIRAGCTLRLTSTASKSSLPTVTGR